MTGRPRCKDCEAAGQRYEVHGGMYGITTAMGVDGTLSGGYVFNPYKQGITPGSGGGNDSTPNTSAP